MARHRRSQDEESLDLLLDTICNVFGGIVFIAILVAVLANAKGGGRFDRETSTSDVVPAGQLLALEAEATSLRRSIAILAEPIPGIDEARLDSKLEEFRRMQRRMDDLQRATDELTAWKLRYEKVIDLVADLPELTQHKQELQEEIDRLKEEIAKDQSKPPTALRLPETRSTSKDQVALLLKGGRIYWLPFGGSQSRVPQERRRDVDMEDQVLGVRVVPRPNGGFTPDEDRGRQLGRFFDAFNTRLHYIHLFVVADSVTLYAQVRAEAATRGFDYNVGQFGLDDPLSFGPTDRSQTQ